MSAVTRPLVEDDMNDGGSAFPQVKSEQVGSGGEYHTEISSRGGMSLRDYFAAQVLPQVYATAEPDTFQHEHWRYYLARDAYALADAMLAARKEERATPAWVLEKLASKESQS